MIGIVVTNDPEGRRLGWFSIAMVCLAVVEVVASTTSGSLGLMTQAVHTAFDAVCVLISFASVALSRPGAGASSPRIPRRVAMRAEVLSGFANGVFLLFASFFLVVEAVERLAFPRQVCHHATVTWVAAFGSALRLTAALSLRGRVGFSSSAGNDDVHRQRHSDAVSVVLLHLSSDGLRSAAVVAGSWASSWRGWDAVDPVLSLVVTAAVARLTLPVVARTARILLQATPSNFGSIYTAILRVRMIEGVLEVRDEHFWALSHGYVVGSLSIRVRSDASEPEVRSAARVLLSPHVNHLTIQVVKDAWLSPSSLLLGPQPSPLSSADSIAPPPFPPKPSLFSAPTLKFE